MIIILGSGLSGLSCSYHLGHERCRILEAKPHPFGHIHSSVCEGFTWDEGPHVSFTKNDYVRDLFARNVRQGFEEYAVRVRNFYRGHWIDHPAQSNLFQVPEPLRGKCLESIREARRAKDINPANYQEWIDYAFGKVFAETFPAAYTKKYWTLDPIDLGVDWIGPRVFFPSLSEVESGAIGPLDRSTHYISKVRYPKRGGYQSFAEFMLAGAQIEYGACVTGVSLRDKKVIYQQASGQVKSLSYDRLVVTIPLPDFVQLCCEITVDVKRAAQCLRCTQVTLVNVTAPHPALVEGNWFYVYDEDKLSVRIHVTERLSPNNAPDGATGLQVEIYHSAWKPLPLSGKALEARVREELVEMGFLDPGRCPGGWDDVRGHTVEVRWANVIFDHQRRALLDTIWNALEAYGLAREEDDLEPFTDWNAAPPAHTAASLQFAGRFGQWRYFWSDDCVLRGKQLAQEKI